MTWEVSEKGKARIAPMRRIAGVFQPKETRGISASNNEESTKNRTGPRKQELQIHYGVLNSLGVPTNWNI